MPNTLHGGDGGQGYLGRISRFTYGALLGFKYETAPPVEVDKLLAGFANDSRGNRAL